MFAFFNQEIAKRLSEEADGFSRWWTLAPMGVLLAYGLTKANYEEPRRAEQANAAS